MKIIEEQEVRKRLTMPRCIALMKQALIKLEKGEAVQPLRTMLSLPGHDLFGFMPAWMDDYFGAKIITGFHGNAGTKYPTHMGYVMVFDSKHGAPVGMADAGAVTELRTGAVSGVATDLLARKDARHLAIIGCGAQARSHLAAMLCVRGIKRVTCYDVVEENAVTFARKQSIKHGVAIKVTHSAKEAVHGADVVCTLTPSKEAYLEAEWIAPGAHINAVGTFSQTTREVGSALVAKARLYADQVDAMKKEAGEYLIPLAEGVIREDHIIGSIGGVLRGKVPGRQTDDDITLFDALGLAVEDVMCAKTLLCESE